MNPKPTSVIFMGVFHCNWMNDIGSTNNYYYITKSYKGNTFFKIKFSFYFEVSKVS